MNSEYIKSLGVKVQERLDLESGGYAHLVVVEGHFFLVFFFFSFQSHKVEKNRQIQTSLITLPV